MKKITALLFFILMTAVCFAQANDPVLGYWLSVDEKTNKVTAGWQIYLENGVLFGRIVSLADEPRGTLATECNASYRNFPLPGRVNQMEVAGPPWIFGLTKHTSGEWRGGNIIDPASGNMYICKIIHRPADGRRYQVETLEMRGEIGLGIGRSQFWRRSTEAEASNLWP
ncbi:MAG: DUF2147 domain-containing protein [Treponema sp.]|nr:DUF2147 domain-containing protein [Treponema sp.]MCL2250559.1 DUF2147 domain-containing protein [Treponema sp.]